MKLSRIYLFVWALLVSGQAFAASKLNLQIMNISPGISTCAASAGSAMRFRFRITNYDAAPVDLNTLKVSFWVNDPSLTTFVNTNWTSINGGAPFQMANHSEAFSASCGSSPRIANQRIDQTWGTSAPIPAGGYAEGEIWYWRGGSVPYDNGCDDYSKMNWTDGLYHEDPYFALYQSNVLVCEYTSSSAVDSNSGQQACNGVSNCSTPTFTITPTVTPTRTPTPRMALTKTANVATAMLGETVTFCIHWFNDSSAGTTRVIRDQVPPYITYVGADNGGALAAGRVTWSVPAPQGSNGNVCFWGWISSSPP